MGQPALGNQHERGNPCCLSRAEASAVLAGGKARLAADTAAESHSPLLAEGLLTVGLPLMGAGGLVYARRRRAAAHRAGTPRD